MEKLEGRRPFERTRRRMRDNIKVGLPRCEMGGGIDWIDLAEDRGQVRAVVNAVMNL